MNAFLGIDLGTSGLKAVVFDSEGRQLGRGFTPNLYLSGSEDTAEQDPELWWDGCCRAVRTALREAGIPSERVMGIGVCGFHHCPVFLGKTGLPVRASIVTHDPRLEGSLEDLKSKNILKRMTELTGSRITTGHFPIIYHHVKTVEKPVLDETRWIILPKDYLRFKLTGRIATELSDATGTHLIAMPGENWSPEICEVLGVQMNKLPEIVDSRQVQGEVSGEAARLTGLRPGTPVVTGGGDSHCALLGLGVVEEMQIGLLLGTNSTMRLVFREFQRLTEPSVWIQRHVVPGRYTASASSMAGASTLSWFKEEILFTDRTDHCSDQADSDTDMLAAGVRPGSDGLFFLPYIYGERSPFYNLKARGSFISFGRRHGRAHFVRSIMEGVAFVVANNLEMLGNLPWGAGSRSASIRTGLGGGGVSATWRQILADALGRPLEVMEVEEPGCLGAALLAGLGTGGYRNTSEAIEKSLRIHALVEPQPDVSELYLDRRRLFNEAYQALEPILYKRSGER